MPCKYSDEIQRLFFFCNKRFYFWRSDCCCLGMGDHGERAREILDEMKRVKQENQKLSQTLRRLCISYVELHKRAESLRARGDVRFERRMPETSIDKLCLGPLRKRKTDDNGKSEKASSSARKAILEAESHQDKRIKQIIPKKFLCIRMESDSSSMINDGCCWRKYGQKMTRNNTQPRSYYKCVMQEGCPVKKQVQRCAFDASIVILTYEGEHTHPLSPLAVAVMESASGELFHHMKLFRFPDGIISTNAFSLSSTYPTITLDLTTANTPPNHAEKSNL